MTCFLQGRPHTITSQRTLVRRAADRRFAGEAQAVRIGMDVRLVNPWVSFCCKPVLVFVGPAPLRLGGSFVC